MPTRMLREGILRSERVDVLSCEAELFFRRLMSVVDDYGRYYATPRMLCSDCYPLKPHKNSLDVESWLEECHSSGLILVYEVGGKRYLEIQNFGQRLRSASRFPAPPVGPGDPPSSRKPLPADTAMQPSGDMALTYDRKPLTSVSEAQPNDGVMRTYVSTAPTSVGDSPPYVRAGANVVVAVVVGEGGGGRAREEPPPLSDVDLQQIAEVLHLHTPAEPLPPDADGTIMRDVLSAIGHATAAEVTDAVFRVARRRTKPPRSYAFWKTVLADELSAPRLVKLRAAATSRASPAKPPACESCRGCGIVGGGADGSLGGARAAVAAGGACCPCDLGETWRLILAGERDEPAWAGAVA